MTPQLLTIEIGNVDDSTITLTFSEPVQANNFADGWTLTKNGVPLPILSTAIISNKVVYFGVDVRLSTDTIQAVYSVAPTFSDPSRTSYINNWTPFQPPLRMPLNY